MSERHVLGTFLAAVALVAAPAPPVVVVKADHKAAAHVQIVGANSAERTATRAALAGLGKRNPFRRVVFADHGKGRQVIGYVRHLADDPTRGFETEWLGEETLRAITGTLAGRGEKVGWFELRPGYGESLEEATEANRSTRELRALAERIAGRAVASGHRVAITAYPLGGGALEIVIRLNERELLSGANSRWLTDLVADRFEASFYSAYLLILGPGDIAVAHGANLSPTSGAWAYGATGRSWSTSPTLRGPVDLTVRIERVFPKRRTFDFRLTCGGGSAGGQECTAFRRQWVSLLPPLADTTCAGGAFDQSSVRGTVAGVSVRREYSNCYATTTVHWEQLFGVSTQR